MPLSVELIRFLGRRLDYGFRMYSTYEPTYHIRRNEIKFVPEIMLAPFDFRSCLEKLNSEVLK